MNYLYLHGFASSPNSTKAQDIQQRLLQLQIPISIPDLNYGGFSDLTITRQIQQITTQFPTNSQPVTLIGSSLGGLTAAHIAQEYLQVQNLILLAPAFGFLSHWLPKLGTGLKVWQLTKYTMIYHYGYKKLLPLHYNFVTDADQYAEDLLQRPIPTLILHGKHDEVIPIQASRHFANSRSWVKLLEFNSDHSLGNVTDEIWQAISSFLPITHYLLPMTNLKFIRSDLAQLNAYKPHPGSDNAEPVNIQFDRLDTNESPLDLPPEIKEKLAWTYQQVIETNRYPDGGHENLKNAIAQYVNESANLANSTFTAANISVGNGSDELIRSLLIATCLGGEGAILVANPTFSMYGILAQTLGISVVTVGRDKKNFETDLAAAQSAIIETENPPIRAVFVVHPNSPTANCLTAAEITWLKSLPEEILVVIDEAYFEFSQTTLVRELLQRPNWIILRTFSKAFRLAAMRVGYCIAHPQAIAILEKVRLPYNLPSFSIVAALTALENRHLLLESIPQALTERNKLITALSAHPTLEITPSATNFIYLRVKTDHSHLENTILTSLNQKLRSQGTLIRLLPHGLRITIGTPAENTRTIERVQAALKE